MFQKINSTYVQNAEFLCDILNCPLKEFKKDKCISCYIHEKKFILLIGDIILNYPINAEGCFYSEFQNYAEFISCDVKKDTNNYSKWINGICDRNLKVLFSFKSIKKSFYMDLKIEFEIINFNIRNSTCDAELGQITLTKDCKY